ncbi:MAG: HEAT repeat domain-containing protein [Chloroflexota bacterium]|nr:HEAT repeat domain-containing protein [Chloroflexota bacterium]
MTSRLLKMSKKEKLTLLADIEDGYRPFDKHALVLLRSLLDDPDAQVRAEAVACLWNDPDPRWIDVLMGKANEDPHAEVRAHAISALGRYVFEGDAAAFEDWDGYEVSITPEDYARVTDFLFRIAQDPEEAVEARRYAIEALAFRSEDPDVLDLIEWAYHHDDRRLRVSALFSMARNGDPRWTECILKELLSRDTEIQYEAVHAAGELGLEEATETLIDMVRGKNVRKPLRLLAIYALGQIGNERAYPVLDRLTRSRDRDVREVAREAVDEWLAVNAAEDMVDDAFQDEDSMDRFPRDTAPEIWDDAMGSFSKN